MNDLKYHCSLKMQHSDQHVAAQVHPRFEQKRFLSAASILLMVDGP